MIATKKVKQTAVGPLSETSKLRYAYDSLSCFNKRQHAKACYFDSLMYIHVNIVICKI